MWMCFTGTFTASVTSCLIVFSGVQMNLTLPVLLRSNGNQYTRSMPIPQVYQTNTPEPVEDGVYIHSRPELRVYVG